MDNKMKTCSKCKKVKSVDDFRKDKSKSDGYYSSCKKCCDKLKALNRDKYIEYAKLYNKKYRENNKAKIQQKQKEWEDKNKDRIKKYRENYYQKNKDKISEKNREYRENNKDIINKKKKEYYQNNKEKIAQGKKRWAQENKEYLKEYRKKYYEENKNKILKQRKEYIDNNKEKKHQRDKKYYKKNKEKLIKYQRIYAKKKREEDKLYRLKKNIRCNIKDALTSRGFLKSKKTEDILGCTINFFIEYIESKFLPGMTWENRNLWHLDHIKPMKLAQTQEDAIQLNRYTNFQPLWIKDNLIKRAIFNKEVQPKLL